MTPSSSMAAAVAFLVVLSSDAALAGATSPLLSAPVPRVAPVAASPINPGLNTPVARPPRVARHMHRRGYAALDTPFVYMAPPDAGTEAPAARRVATYPAAEDVAAQRWVECVQPKIIEVKPRATGGARAPVVIHGLPSPCDARAGGPRAYSLVN